MKKTIVSYSKSSFYVFCVFLYVLFLVDIKDVH